MKEITLKKSTHFISVIFNIASMIIPAPFEPPVRSLRATLPAHQSHTFR